MALSFLEVEFFWPEFFENAQKISLLKSVPGLADVGVPHGDGDGPRTPPRCKEGGGSGKNFK